MRILKPFALAAITAAALALVLAGPASATLLTGSGGTLGSGTELKAENEGTVTLHPPIGDIECKKSSVAGKTTNGGGEGETIKGTIESLSFSECNATVTVLVKGELSVEGTGSEYGTLRSTNTEVTVELSGFHCIFKTSSTDIGTVTGSTITGGNATFDIEATIPRTGGRSGAFCGSTAQWTGSYKISSPNPLYVDGASGEVIWGNPLTMNVGEEKVVVWTNKSAADVTVTSDANSDNTVVETKGVQCGKIAKNGGKCETRIAKCLKKGSSTLTNFAGAAVVGKAVLKCD
jgi:hypothetical protein